MKFMGVKLIDAEAQERDGQPGYRVTYPDGYVSWSPMEAFEKAYMPLPEANKIDKSNVDHMIDTYTYEEWDPATMVIKVQTVTGFRLTDSSSSVDPATYEKGQRAYLACRRIEEKLWEHLDFVLQWAMHGLKR